MTDMRAVLFTQPGELAYVSRPIPQPGIGQVLVQVDAAGVCTTDVHIFHGHFPIKPPRVLGHEIAGTVVAVGADVAQSWIGQSVGIQPARYCGVCSACRRDNPGLCANFQCLGNTHDGGYAEYTVVPVDQLIALGDVPIDKAVWLEPLACVLHALMRVSLAQQPVLIAGAGTFGKLFTQILSNKYDLQVGVVDPNQERLDQAMSMGAARVWQVPREGTVSAFEDQIKNWADSGPALLIDTTGKGNAIQRLIEWAAPGATVFLFGISAPDLQISIAPASLLAKELCLTTSNGMTTTDFKAAFQLLQEDKLSFEPLISARVGLEAIPELLPQMPPGKLMINPHRNEK